MSYISKNVKIKILKKIKRGGRNAYPFYRYRYKVQKSKLNVFSEGPISR